jgi:hypothetical protein
MNVRNVTQSLGELIANVTRSNSSSSTGMISSTLQSTSSGNYSGNATLAATASEPLTLNTIILAGTIMTLGMVVAGCLLDRYWVRNHQFWQQEQQAARRGDYRTVDLEQEEEDAGNRLVTRTAG